MNKEGRDHLFTVSCLCCIGCLIGIPFTIDWIRNEYINSHLIAVDTTITGYLISYSPTCEYDCGCGDMGCDTCTYACYGGNVQWTYTDKVGTNHSFIQAIYRYDAIVYNRTHVEENLIAAYPLNTTFIGYYFDEAPYTKFQWDMHGYTVGIVFAIIFDLIIVFAGILCVCWIRDYRASQYVTINPDDVLLQRDGSRRTRSASMSSLDLSTTMV